MISRKLPLNPRPWTRGVASALRAARHFSHYNLCVQFPLDTVREVAQILQTQGLGEITLETAGARLTLKRPPHTFPVVIAQPGQESAGESENSDSLPTEIEVAETKISIVSPAVGVFREAKNPLQVGDEVNKKAILGSVETLNIPTELIASENARVLEILAIEGQRVEWGQPLLVLEPAAPL